LQNAQHTTSRLQRQTEHKLVQSLQASALVHELRQPLSQLLLQLKRLQHRMEQQAAPDPVLEQSLDELLQSGRQMDGLIDAIHRLLGPAPRRFTRLNLCAIAAASLQALRPALQAEAVAVQVADLDQPAWIQADAAHLQIAVANLLRNALEALRHTPPPRQLRLQIDRTREAVVLQVGDSGPGLPVLDWRQLLLNSSATAGMGLGLMIVQSIASNHGGRLILGRSADLGGALVSLSLPLASLAPDNADSDTEPPAAPARRR
jgi:signal transduction histidine kinase